MQGYLGEIILNRREIRLQYIFERARVYAGEILEAQDVELMLLDWKVELEFQKWNNFQAFQQNIFGFWAKVGTIVETKILQSFSYSSNLLMPCFFEVILLLISFSC